MPEAEKKTEALYHAMAQYDAGDPKRIQHFTKVWTYARLIGLGERLNEETLFTLECAAIVHDIGIHKAEALYHSTSGKYQEELGPAEAEKLLNGLDFPADVTERVCFLVGHHHTYSGIDGMDWQILVEADFLVNLYEDNSPREAAVSAYKSVFRTVTGRKMWEEMYGNEYRSEA